MSAKLLELTPQRRDAILNAALKEFILKGFDHASTNVIAKEAGLSKALLFHYVSSKQALFLSLYDYFSGILDSKYFQLMDFQSTDLFDRLRQSYLLQIKLLKKYPWILEFGRLSAKTNSNEVNEQLEMRTDKQRTSCECRIFDQIDESKFRDGLNIEKCMQLILWSNIGFTGEILAELQKPDAVPLDAAQITTRLDEYFDELRKIYYKSNEMTGISNNNRDGNSD